MRSKKGNSHFYLDNIKLVPKSKRSQLKIQEMSFMLIAVVLFFVLVGLFVLAVFYVRIFDQANNIAQERTLSSVRNIANSPELNCNNYKSNCVDGDKLMALSMDNNYQRFFPYSSLRVVLISGFNKSYEDMNKCDSINYPNCELIEAYNKKVRNERQVANFVAFCRTAVDNGIYEKCEIAKLIAGTEIKNG